MDGAKERTKQNQKQASIRLSIIYLTEIKRNTKEPNHSKLACPLTEITMIGTLLLATVSRKRNIPAWWGVHGCAPASLSITQKQKKLLEQAVVVWYTLTINYTSRILTNTGGCTSDHLVIHGITVHTGILNNTTQVTAFHSISEWHSLWTNHVLMAVISAGVWMCVSLGQYWCMYVWHSNNVHHNQK